MRDASPVYTLNPEADPAIVAAIDAAKAAGDTLGGVVETVVTGCPIGLGSHAQWDRKLDARLALAVMSIQAIKAVEIGLGVEAARRPGSKVMDPIAYEADHPADDRRFGFRRPTNNAGGIEGGTSNGEPIVVRASKKPISTLAARGPSVNMATKAPQPAAYERSDVCAVPAASVIVENVVAFEIAAAVVEKYVGTSLAAIKAAHDATPRAGPEASDGGSGEGPSGRSSELRDRCSHRPKLKLRSRAVSTILLPRQSSGTHGSGVVSRQRRCERCSDRTSTP